MGKTLHPAFAVSAGAVAFAAALVASVPAVAAPAAPVAATLGAAAQPVATVAAATGTVTAAETTSRTAGRAFTANDLVTLTRLSGPALSPDGTQVAYQLRTTDLAANRGSTSIWLVKTEPGAAPTQLVSGATSPRWSADGRYVYYMTPEGQVWRIAPATGAKQQMSKLPLEVEAFQLAADGKRAVVALAVFPDCPTLECTATRLDARKKTKRSGTVYDRLFVRHWDTWADGTRNHLFAVDLGDGAAPATGAVSLMRDFDGDSPSKPFGGDDDFAISPDSGNVVFSAKLAGRTEAWSTNFDLYEVPLDGSRPPADLTADNAAADAGPVFSPDGSQLAYLAQTRPGFESDRYHIMLRDLRTGRTREVAPDWDRSAGSLQWSGDGSALYATADEAGTHRLFSIDVASGKATARSTGGAIEGYVAGKDALIFSRSSLTSPANLFLAKAPSFEPVALTDVDAAALSGIALSRSQTFTFAGWNGDRVQGRVTQPFGFAPGRRYPVAFLIHGGPQGSWSDGWSYRWNPQFYAGLGYAVVTIDFHGSTGYGQGFTDAISRHWGDRPLQDLQKGWAAALAQFPYLDGDRACALGASYGGFMIDWIAGNWPGPWKCLVSHDGVFDNRMMGYATDELWFSEWENGGTPWDHAEDYERFNPIDHVADWKDPILVIHSERDYRIPVDQGIAAFTAAQRRGIPSEFLTFPDENHWVLKPQNSLQWHETVAAWLDRWIGH
jgi:acylaminoacyl-peptidase